MRNAARHFNPSEAAKRLGVSVKALRLYEQRGLIEPVRTAAGWRAYGPSDMARATEIVALRKLGLSLAQVTRVLKGDPAGLEPALAAHQARLELQIRELSDTAEKVNAVRTSLADGKPPSSGALVRLLEPDASVGLSLDLPWPWGGERFELLAIRRFTYIVGPRGSGKTRLARAIAETLPDAAFIGLDRLRTNGANGANARDRIDADPAVKLRVDRILGWLVEDGATASPSLHALVVALESAEASVLVVDLVEQGLDQASQEALIAHLRQRDAGGRPLFLLTRSSSILDLDAVRPDEAIILCPANHNPPSLVAPFPGAPGYEAVATCLASPEVRARTEGVIAWRPGDISLARDGDGDKPSAVEA